MACHRVAFFLVLLAVLACLTTRAQDAAPPAFVPPVNTSAFEAAAGGALYIGNVFGAVDDFVAIVGKNLSFCDPAGYSHGDARLWMTVGNLTITNFPISVRYVCGKLADPRWMPQVTVTGKGAALSGDGDGEGDDTKATSTFSVQNFELEDFEISMVGRWEGSRNPHRASRLAPPGSY
jgi:hypothetical protein